MTYGTRILAVIVGRKSDDIFSEMSTRVEIVDEGAGEFIEVRQHGRTDVGKISISPEEWPELRAAIDGLTKGCRRQDSSNESR